MVKHLTPKNSLLLQSKDKHFTAQLQATYNGFYEKPQTMKELSVQSCIDRANICRYCKVFRLQNTLYVISKKYCSITKHLANVYSTNKKYKPHKQQLELFTA